MYKLKLLKEELARAKINRKSLDNICDYMMYLGYKEHYNDDSLTAKAYATAKLFTGHEKRIYDNDLIIGSVYGKFSDKYTVGELDYAAKITNSFGKNTFLTNSDHFAPDFETPLNQRNRSLAL